jgi:ssRNA-specific RNase YbeY (16S rRNA maturation enzyme)
MGSNPQEMPKRFTRTWHLPLLGYDYINDKDYTVIQEQEDEILRQLKG